MTDAEAHMALVLGNAQGELTPLERGLHFLASGMGVREYARATGQSEKTVSANGQAAEVSTRIELAPHLRDHATHLRLIHAAPDWLWRALVDHCLPAGSEPMPSRKVEEINDPHLARDATYTPSERVAMLETIERKPLGDQRRSQDFASVDQAARWQQLAAVPEGEFEAHDFPV